MSSKLARNQKERRRLRGELARVRGSDTASKNRRKALKKKILDLKKKAVAMIGFAVHVDKWSSHRPKKAKAIGSPTKKLPDTVTHKKSSSKGGIILVGAGGAGAGGSPLIRWRRFPFFDPKVNKGGAPGIVPIPGAAEGGAGRVSGGGGGAGGGIVNPYHPGNK